jgi:hypothetical protein
MATKTVPLKNKSTSANDDLQEPSIITIKQATCKNLQGTATLTYHISRDDNSALFWKIHSNTGAGMFSNKWIPFKAIQDVLSAWSSELPITAISWKRVMTVTG